jgi:hypothetical protein
MCVNERERAREGERMSKRERERENMYIYTHERERKKGGEGPDGAIQELSTCSVYMHPSPPATHVFSLYVFS